MTDTVEAIVAELMMTPMDRKAANKVGPLLVRLQSAHDAEVGALRREVEVLDTAVANAMALLKDADTKADHEAYWQGWRMCAKWANRDDLLADRDSPAYARDRDNALAGDGNG